MIKHSPEAWLPKKGNIIAVEEMKFLSQLENNSKEHVRWKQYI